MLNMVSIKAHSTEKIKPSTFENRQCLTCPKSKTNIHRRDYDIAKPVRIFELLKEDKDEQKVEKSSTYKKILPERVGICTDSKPKSRVRKNLNFNITSNYPPNNKTNSVHILDKSDLISSHCTTKQVLEPKVGRTLLAPNSIKNIHLQKHKKETDKKSKLDALKENVSPEKKSGIPIYHDKSKQNIFNHNYSITKGRAKITSNNITTKKPLQASQFINSQQNNRFQTSSANETYLKHQGTEPLEEKDVYIERLHDNLQNTKMMVPENGLNAKDTLSETISINVNEVIHLKRELENLTTATEENLNKLKSTLSRVTRLLIPQESVQQSSISNSRGEHVKLSSDKEVQVDICCKLLRSAQKNSNIHSSGISEMHRIEKENLTIRCKNLSGDNSDDSFLNLEDELGIEQSEPIKNLSICPMQNTPVIKKCMHKRSLREYISLKSTMSFLQTPDGKALYQRNNKDRSDVLSRTLISNKVLTDFQSLYSDSPDST
ncbi:uncharacterized protein LOC144468636 [Augochlora pura]